MPTNLAIDDELLSRAVKVGRMRTKKETVTVALEEFIQRRRQREVLEAMGTISFRRNGDHKRGRRRAEHRR